MPRNYPKEKLLEMADKAIEEMAKQGCEATAFFKATCPKCNARVEFDAPNTIYDNMECCECHHTFPFVEGGFALIITTLEPTEEFPAL